MGDEKDELIKIVGGENVIDEPETLSAYSRDQSFVTPRKPRFVVKPKNTDEVQGIVRWANQRGTPLVPVSSGPPHFRGDTVPTSAGAVIVDLSGMKRIIRVDRRNTMVMVEPGVTFSQLQPELAKEGLYLPLPLLPRSNKSVIGSLLEREPSLVPKHQWDLTHPLRCMEVVWGNGDVLRTGEAGRLGTIENQWKLGEAQVLPCGPAQVDYYRLLQGAQGTMGIASWASVSCEVLPQLRKLFFAQSERLEDLLGFAYRLLRFRYAEELLFLDSSELACILGEGADQIRVLREELPPWVLIVGVAGYGPLPKERFDFQEKEVEDIAQQFGVRLLSAIPGARDGQVLEALLTPSAEPYWKLRYKGGCQGVFFLTTLNRTPEFVSIVRSVAEALRYSTLEIGVYIQPVMQGESCHCEFSLFFDPSDQTEVTKIQKLLTEGSEALMKIGAFFSRPYGTWADMVYNRDARTTIALRKIKGIFDPKNVMNPGKLCF